MRFCWPLAAVLVLIGCGRPKAADADEEVKPIAVVTLARVTKRPIRELINVSGTLVPSPGTSAKLTPATADKYKDRSKRPAEAHQGVPPPSA